MLKIVDIKVGRNYYQTTSRGPISGAYSQCLFRNVYFGKGRHFSANLENCRFEECIFEGIEIVGRFENCSFEDCRIGEVKLFTSTRFFNTSFKTVRFDGTKGLEFCLFDQECSFERTLGAEIKKGAHGNFLLQLRVEPDAQDDSDGEDKYWKDKWNSGVQEPVKYTSLAQRKATYASIKKLGSLGPSSRHPKVLQAAPPYLLPPVSHYRSPQPEQIEWRKEWHHSDNSYNYNDSVSPVGGYLGIGAGFEGHHHYFDGDSGDAYCDDDGMPTITKQPIKKLIEYVPEYKPDHGKEYGYGKSAILECPNIELFQAAMAAEDEA